MVRFLLAAGVLVLALAPADASSGGGEEESFRFPKGTRWTYLGTSAGVKTRLTQEVFKISQGDLFVKGEPATVQHLLMRTVKEDPPTPSEQITTTSYVGFEDGYLVTGTLGGVPVRLYKLGSRKGDTWSCVDPRLRPGPERVFTHLGVEKVVVPAGVFTHARHIQVRIDSGEAHHVGDFYIVPKVGIVKTEASSEENGVTRSVTLELDAFAGAGEF